LVSGGARENGTAGLDALSGLVMGRSVVRYLVWAVLILLVMMASLRDDESRVVSDWIVLVFVIKSAWWLVDNLGG
jgi:hypothetical protein